LVAVQPGMLLPSELTEDWEKSPLTSTEVDGVAADAAALQTVSAQVTATAAASHRTMPRRTCTHIPVAADRANAPRTMKALSVE
jgi:hypothetical protein